jgi:hypothetical protein
MSSIWTYRADQELPSWAADWKDRDGNLINFATGWTFAVKLMPQTGSGTGLTKTTGITGYATSPNIVVAWAPGELNIAPNIYKLHLTAIGAGGDRVYRPGDPPKIQIVAAPT